MPTVILLQLTRSTAVIYLLGDSTLDNKAWFSDTARAINGYENFLDPPISRQDVAYCINKELSLRGLGGQFIAGIVQVNNC